MDYKGTRYQSPDNNHQGYGHGQFRQSGQPHKWQLQSPGLSRRVSNRTDEQLAAVKLAQKLKNTTADPSEPGNSVQPVSPSPTQVSHVQMESKHNVDPKLSAQSKPSMSNPKPEESVNVQSSAVDTEPDSQPVITLSQQQQEAVNIFFEEID